MKHAEHLDYFLDIEEETGVTPEPLLTRPELPRHLLGIYEIFLLLSAGRGYGMAGIQPIASVDILAAGAIVEPEEPTRFFRVIRELDALVLSLAAKKAESKRKSSDSKSGKSRR